MFWGTLTFGCAHSRVCCMVTWHFCGHLMASLWPLQHKEIEHGCTCAGLTQICFHDSDVTFTTCRGSQRICQILLSSLSFSYPIYQSNCRKKLFHRLFIMSNKQVFSAQRKAQFYILIRLIFWFPTRYGAANMAAVKPIMQQQQQPGGAKPNTSYNNNNGRTAAPSMHQEQSIAQVRNSRRKSIFLQNVTTLLCVAHNQTIARIHSRKANQKPLISQ